MCDYFLGAGDSGGGGLTVVGGVCGGVVHADFADEGALAKIKSCGGEEFGGGDVEGGVVGGCGDALVEGLGYAGGVDGLGVGGG